MSKGTQYALAIAILLVSAVGLSGGLYAILRMSDVVEVGEDLCPLKGTTNAHTVVAVDWTDPFSSEQRTALRKVVHGLKDQLAVHERLSLFLITGSPEDSANPKFSVCKPLDIDKINPLIANQRRLKKKWEEQFGKPLDDQLAELLKGGTARYSPIMEAIDVIMASPNFQADLHRRQLIVFSDLLQNWQDHNHYQKVPPVCEFLNTPLALKLKARNWKVLDVVFHYQRNPRHYYRFQGPHHLHFWTQTFLLLGASKVREGANEVPLTETCTFTGSTNPMAPKLTKPTSEPVKPKKPKPVPRREGGLLDFFQLSK